CYHERMDALVLLSLIALVPVVAALLLRVSGVFLFLSIAAGYLLVQYVGDDAGLTLGIVVKTSNVNMLAQLVVLLLPTAISLLFLKQTLPKHKLLLHVPLHIANGFALAVLVLPLLDSTMQEKIYANQYG